MLFVIASRVCAVNLGARLQFEYLSISTCLYVCLHEFRPRPAVTYLCYVLFVATGIVVALLGLLFLLLLALLSVCLFVCAVVFCCWWWCWGFVLAPVLSPCASHVVCHCSTHVCR